MKLSAWALWCGLPRLLIDPIRPEAVGASRYRALQYWAALIAVVDHVVRPALFDGHVERREQQVDGATGE